ncbi:Sad1 / UNC-like protein [Oesophagostomum dentatum]|uniref:Sad1 / UNC-like protein n=1 Tax=Oesophagostomum dentatum TaxID=61180 RepID=A0A0B1SLI7_OESDE|nr:Sad1 / UNC-like protein [Oesophagostomum dentatum]
MQDALPMGGLVRYETTMDSMQLMDSRLERFEKQQMMWQHVYQEKIEEIEKSMQTAFKEIQKQAQEAISELRSELTKQKREQEDKVKSTVEGTSSFHKEMVDKLKSVEDQLASRLAELESRIVTANERIRTLSSSNMLKSSNETAKELLAEVKRRHAVNLASRSHGASVVSKLTSKATTSSSLLLNLVDTVFPLETYNFAITERTHITPSEAFCFDGSEGKLTIRLWANATVEAVEYEHDYWRDVVPISAPERCDVMACMDHDCQQKVLLGECSYPSDEKAGPAQICEMEVRLMSCSAFLAKQMRSHG